MFLIKQKNINYMELHRKSVWRGLLALLDKYMISLKC